MSITFSDIQQAHTRISPYILKTPVLSNEVLNEIAGTELFFKCENLQHIGAFKARGAINAVLQLSNEQKKQGVATHSSGNHAQALAYAARLFDLRAYIVMPSTSSKVKLAGVKRLGAEIILCEPTQQSREQTLDEVVKKTGAFFIPPYNHEWVMAGQGTAALELLQEKNDLKAVIAPVGGGGLISGTCIAVHGFNKNIDVFAGEPALANDAFTAMKSGEVKANPLAQQSIADGLRTPVGDKPFPIIQQHIKQIIEVGEDEIVHAMKLVWENLKIIIEPSSAVPVAAILQQKKIFAGKKTGVIVTGGNVDLTALPF